jgi:hypothetical protein
MPKDDFIPLAIETYNCLHLHFYSFFISYLHVDIIHHQQISLVPSTLIFYYKQQMSLILLGAQTITILQKATMLNHSFSFLPHIPISPPASLANLW